MSFSLLIFWIYKPSGWKTNGAFAIQSYVDTGTHFIVAETTRRRFLKGLGAMGLLAASGRLCLAAASQKLPDSVLILGDSMALCGFGERLDADFRKAGVAKVFTYMVCGTNPLSFVSRTTQKTHCGFWSIESSENGPPVSHQDTYGMTRGHKPGTHDVPKIVDLLKTIRPQILVVQLGNNLFDLFGDGRAGVTSATFERYIAPFLEATSPLVSRIYWVAPPICGRVKKEKHDLLFNQIKSHESGEMIAMDSRVLLPGYPYSLLEPDKQHFMGKDMTLWADRVFEEISANLEQHPLSSKPMPPANPAQQAAPVAPPPEKERPPAKAILHAQCTLIRVEKPHFGRGRYDTYGEYLYPCTYIINNVIKGHYRKSKLVVWRVALLGNKRQPLAYRIGQQDLLNLVPMADAGIEDVRHSDNDDSLQYDGFITEEDLRRLRAKLSRRD